MANACALPISVAGALMPDAHVGYGLPIGGVLATENAVIPYAVGVDIACRMKLTVFDRKANTIAGQKDRLANIIESETRFGMGCDFKQRREHEVMDEDWDRLADHATLSRQSVGAAWHQRLAAITLSSSARSPWMRDQARSLGIEPGEYVALLSHSGSRGTGAQVCQHYSRVAMDRHAELPKELKHLAWLALDEAAGPGVLGRDEPHGPLRRGEPRADPPPYRPQAGRERDARYREPPQLRVEGAPRDRWRRARGDRASQGRDAGGRGRARDHPRLDGLARLVVRGRGEPESLNSASHGAGRVMSRTKALQSFTWSAVKKLLAERDVTLLSAGLDEVPGVYKDIEQVMAAQTDLVEVLGRFDPRLVKMCPSGERPED